MLLLDAGLAIMLFLFLVPKILAIMMRVSGAVSAAYVDLGGRSSARLGDWVSTTPGDLA